VKTIETNQWHPYADKFNTMKIPMVMARDAGGALSQGILPFAYLAGVNFKSIGQFVYRLFTL